ncbi:non-ribosomal peptide synthetase [Polyangium mundeleinium]|uniref:Amino acid adenylation domain-containing protein n=1 Tax=Polyangium mundeleinium TaxID=2995306 RepID=A0ABT5F0W0_9BACT|nr:non-ribosomal peptide synthetase [Polyangium mundeleinium]MDC0747078.1 amino acid adenylation domain-containing protein [Polyangium mundeleinium]
MGRCIHASFQEQAARTPDAVALVCEDERWSYRALAVRAHALARRLRSMGVEPGVRVGLCMDRSPEMVQGILGVLESGGAYVPLDLAHPAERIAFMLEDTKAPVLVTKAHLSSRLAAHTPHVVLLDEELDVARDDTSGPPPDLAAPSDVAYVIYTSGTTGKPKGVQITHENLSHYAEALSSVLGIEAADRYLHTASFGFSSSVRQLFLPLLRGATSVIATSDQQRSPKELWSAVRRHEVTVLDVVPSHFRALNLALSEHPPAARAQSVDPHLRMILSASEPLSSDVPRAFRALAGDRVVVVNMFGHTETSGIVTTHRVRGDEPLGRGVPLGVPLPRTRVHVLDADRRPVPVGAEGEIHIGGPGVARGYLNRPELDRERFSSDPFTDEPGARLYRTGDIGRVGPDGLLEFVGRIDHQVKIRGFRIELEEIEAALSAHPAVRACVVLAEERAPRDARLVAYVVPEGGELGLRALREHAKAALPAYMIPAVFVPLDALPRTPNGKVDRRALPPVGDAEAAGSSGYVAPVTKTETLLAQLWAEVLGLERVGLHDDVFDCGGHSLSATRVASRLASSLGVEVPIRTLLEARTLAAQARAIDAAGTSPLGAPITRVDRSRRLPLSFAQERLWFLERLHPGSAQYNVPSALRLRGKLDVGALQAALDALVARHESLRVALHEDEAGPFQVISAAGDVELSIERVPDEAALRERLARKVDRPFDLAEGRLLRASAFALSDEDHVLLVEVHHVAFDGWSAGILMRELARDYTALAAGRAPVSLPPGIDYVDFAVWQRSWLSGDALERRMPYWRDNLTGAEALDLPADRPRPSVSSGRGGWFSVRFDHALGAGVDSLARALGVTPFMLLLAAFAVVLSRHAGQDDIVIGTPVAGRHRAELEGIIGFFANTLALRMDLSGDPTVLELLGRVRRTTLDAYTHQDVPFEKVVEALRLPRDGARTPLVRVMFVQQAATEEPPRMGELSVAPWPVARSTARFDLTLSLERAPEGYRGGVEYDVDRFESSTIARLCGHLEQALAQMVAAPGARLSEMDILPPDERRKLVLAWNETTTGGPPAACVHDRFRAWATRTPDAVALHFDGDGAEQTLTYGALKERATRLGRHLRALGAGPETVVGLCLPPSIERILGLLAILEAGSAYLPLDPAYPPERLAFLLEDARPPLVVTCARSQARLAGYRGHIVVLGAEDAASDAASTDREGKESQADAHDLAYLVYTSGSTGKPKGVLVEHRGLANAIDATIRMFEVTPADRVLQLASPSFDVASLEVWMALAAGATLYLGTRDELSPGDPLRAFLARHAITIVSLTPSTLGAMSVTDLPALRLLNLGGETCGPSLARAWASPGRRLVNSYGPTEATIWSTAAWIQDPHEPSLIGRPIANTQVYILDRRGRLAPIGVPGELCLGGVGVARGYLNRPELTEERFVHDPFREGRLYRTGDLARYREDGTIEFLGRIDRQVKIRGFRVELGEIEAALSAHPGVQDAVVVVREDRPGDTRLVAYVVPKMPGVEAELRPYLASRLPDFMVPSGFVPLSALPLGAHGKLDLRALPDPSSMLPERTNGLVSPRGPTEATVARIWREVLRVGEISVHDDFFSLGGHSLLATQIIARIREALGVSPSLRSLFHEPTVARMAEQIEALRLARDLAPPATAPLASHEEISL